MIRVLIISDFTESFSHKLLAGIVDYSRRKEQWIVRRMPPEYKAKIGIPGVIRVAKDWGIDAVIGQFEPTDDVGLFAENGLVAIAQDYKKRFATIPNITADYIGTGRMAAKFFLERGFRNFGFFELRVLRVQRRVLVGRALRGVPAGSGSRRLRRLLLRLPDAGDRDGLALPAQPAE